MSLHEPLLPKSSNRLMFLEHMENHPSPCPQCQSKNICMHKGDFTCRDCGMTATFEITFNWLLGESLLVCPWLRKYALAFLPREK